MAHIDGNSLRDAVDRARELLDQVGLTRKADSRPGRLSGGEQQRVNIARPLMNNPSVILIHSQPVRWTRNAAPRSSTANSTTTRRLGAVDRPNSAVSLAAEGRTSIRPSSHR